MPENPDKPDGRRLSIGIAVIPAAAGRALRDPIVVLMGGPGEDAISAAAVFTDLLAPLLAGSYGTRAAQVQIRTYPQSVRTAFIWSVVPLDVPVPALFVSGDSDSASPLWFTERVAAGFPDRKEVILGGRGHTEWDGCVARLYEQFVRSGKVGGLDASSCKLVPRPPFRTQ